MLEKVKAALRISHSSLDDVLNADIAAAQAEMVRAGVDPEKAIDTADPLIIRAIKTFCLAEETEREEDKDGYADSFHYQLENLRKSSGYYAED